MRRHFDRVPTRSRRAANWWAGGQAAGSLANHETASEAPGPYRGRFQALDETTGEPIPNHPYTIHASDGSVISGNTDAQGYTQWHEADSPVSLRFSSRSTQVKGGAADA
jgi:uncharacterized protein (DUF2345 family)